MDIAQIKFEISKILTEMKTLLQVRDFQVNFSSGKTLLLFHGYEDPDVYENDIVDNFYGQLDEWIYLCYLNELDNDKRALLVESILDRLNFSDPYTTKNYDNNIGTLNQKQKELLHRFESIQWSMQLQISEIFSEKYLPEVNVNMKKIAKIQWLGEQKELAELFDQLKRKKWIKVTGSAGSYYRTIDLIFDVSGSKNLQKNFKTYHSSSTMYPITTQGEFSCIPQKYTS